MIDTTKILYRLYNTYAVLVEVSTTKKLPLPTADMIHIVFNMYTHPNVMITPLFNIVIPPPILSNNIVV